MNRYVCIHAHFYQPPRENPWLEEVELQDSAYPYHDWNERITAECYAPNTASRILDDDRRIIDIVSNYTKISFNFGPTLLSWMERNKPEVYQEILQADKDSQKYFSGHSSALAQCYNHMIMPLANTEDKRTQVIWGIKDFEYRFKRKPEGMWLPETAVDKKSLEILAEQGVKFTILAPHQARRIRKIGEKRWRDVSRVKIDPKMPYLCKLPSGKSIVLFFYDGPISNDVAFGDLLKSGENFAKRISGAFSKNQVKTELVHIATDGETFGHHHKFGDMALTYCLYYMESGDFAKITIYAEYLEKFPPIHEVEIYQNSSWSCSHGVERWKNDCGCNTGKHPEWNQAWRAKLRKAMNWLRANLIQIYEEQASGFLKDPWLARDDYIEIILHRSVEKVEGFFYKHGVKELSRDEKIKVLKLLEMQRHSMLMYTSCGWFFDDVSGIETIQIMQYAARAIQLAKETSGAFLEEDYVSLLKSAPSNIPGLENGARIYEKFIRPSVLDLLRVGAHLAVSSLFKDYPRCAKIYSYTAKTQKYERQKVGRLKLVMGNVNVRSDVSWEEKILNFAVAHLRDHNIIGGVKEHKIKESFPIIQKKIEEAFSQSDIPKIITLMDKHFKGHSYSLWHLFKDEQREILDNIMKSTLEDIESSFRRIYERYQPISQVMNEFRIPLPKFLASVAGFVLAQDIRKLLEEQKIDMVKLQRLVNEIKKGFFELDKDTLSFITTRKINSLMYKFSQKIEDFSLLKDMVDLLKIADELSLSLNIWETQNIYFSTGKLVMESMQLREEKGDKKAEKWLDNFMKLGEYLQVKII